MSQDSGGTTGLGSAGRPRRISRDARRDSLLDIAADLVVAESPEAVTMELVAERAGVSRPLVYKHFANRDELLAAVYRREAARLDAELLGEVGAAKSVEDMFRTLIQGALRAADERGHLFSSLRAAGGSSAELRREQNARDRRTVRGFARYAIDELAIDPNLGPTAISLLLSLVDPVLQQWRADPSPERAELLEDGYMVIVTATLERLSNTD